MSDAEQLQLGLEVEEEANGVRPEPTGADEPSRTQGSDPASASLVSFVTLLALKRPRQSQ